jgi:putative spermidine/putrescine transport system permease protein
VSARQNYFKLGAIWLAAPALLFLLVFLLLPCLQLLSLSLQDAQTGAFSLAAYRRAFGATLYMRVLSSTFLIALQTTLLCLGLGYPLAYWLAGQKARRQRALTLLVLFAFWTSALVKSFVWLILLGHTGPLVSLLQWLGMTQAPELLFNRTTVVLAMVHTLLPLAVVTMLPSIIKVDKQVVRAAATLGANGPEAFWRVTFPLSMPGVASAGLLVFIAALGFYVTPALLGGPRDTMLGQLIIQQILSQQNWAFGGALAAMLVGSALLVSLVYDRLFGLSGMGGATGTGGGRQLGRERWSARLGLWLLKRLATVAGALARQVAPGRVAWMLPGYSWVLIGVLLLPILACIPMGFTRSTFLSFPPPGYSTRWFEAYFESTIWMGATLRSFGVGLASAALTLAIAAPASYGIARSAGRLGGMVFLVVITPLIIPGVVMAVGLFTLFARIGLIATDLGIVLGHTISGIPLAVIILLAQWRQYDWRLNQAAITLGAGRIVVFRRITAPLIKAGLVAAFIFAFLNSFEELTVALFIGGGLKVTLPRQMWDDINLQVTPTLAAASLVVLSVVTCLFLAAERLRPAPLR